MAAGQEGRQARPLKQFTLCGELLFTTDNGQPICDRHSPCCRLHHLGSQRCFGFPDVRRLGSASRFSIAFSVPGPALGLGYNALPVFDHALNLLGQHAARRQSYRRQIIRKENDAAEAATDSVVL